LIPIKSTLWRKIFGPIYSKWPKMTGPMMKRSLGQKFFFFIFLSFERHTTNYRGMHVENVKKINPPWCTVYMGINVVTLPHATQAVPNLATWLTMCNSTIHLLPCADFFVKYMIWNHFDCIKLFSLPFLQLFSLTINFLDLFTILFFRTLRTRKPV
jgi:hypothetical protein